MNEKKPLNTSYNNHPIGIIDSGVGGLSIAKAITQQLPNEQLIYVADTLHSPYGDKSISFIQQRINTLCQALLNHHVKAIVIACNTATVNAIDQLRSQINIPIIGVEPAIKPAAKQSATQQVGILVTQATAENKRFNNLVKLHSNNSEVHIQPCPGLVELIESGQKDSDRCKQLLHQYISPLLALKVDTLVLGCTHYPFLKEQINSITDNKIEIIDTAKPVAAQLNKRLIALSMLTNNNQSPAHQFFTTHDSAHQQQLFNELWQSSVTLQIF